MSADSQWSETEQAPPVEDTRDPGEIEIEIENPETPQQDPEDAPNRLDSTIFSPAFTFVEYRSYKIMSGGEDLYHPDMKADRVVAPKPLLENDVEPPEKGDHGADDLPWVPVQNKWLYLFQDHQNAFTWFSESYIDAKGLIASVDLTGAKDKEPDDRPAPQSGHELACVAHTINGNPAFYYGYLSRVRLPRKAIRLLLQHGKQLLQCVDTNVKEPRNPKAGLIRRKDDVFFFGVTDPMTVALNLGREYLVARMNLLTNMLPSDELGAGVRREVEEKQAKYMIAGILERAMKSNVKTAEQLSSVLKKTDGKGKFLPPPIEHFRNYRESYEETLRTLTARSEAAAAALCSWLAGTLMGVAWKAHSAKLSDIPAYLRVHCQAALRVGESDAGQAYLGDILENPEHWIHQYVLPAETPGATTYGIIASSASAVYSLSEQLAARYILLNGAKAASYVVDSLNTVVGGDVFRAAPVEIMGTRLDGSKKAVSAYEIRTDMSGEMTLARFFEKGSKANTYGGKAIYFAGVGSFLLAAKSLYDGGFEALTAEVLLGAAASVADVSGSTLGYFAKMGDKGLAVLGGISAAIGFGIAVKGIATSIDRQDYTGAVGYSSQAIGAGLTLYSCYLTYTGGAAGATGFGVPLGAALAISGAVLGVLGSVIVAIGAHSDLMVFTNHCAFGAAYGEGGEMSWSGKKKMSEWKAKPSLQVAALVSILASFKVEKGTTLEPGIEIVPGLTRKNSTFVIRYKSEFHTYMENTVRPYSLDTTVELSMRDLTLKQTGGEHAVLTDCFAHEMNTAKGRRIQVINVPQPQFGTSKVIKCNATVHLEYSGDDVSSIPAEKASWPKVEIV